MFARGLTDGPDAEAQIMAAKQARNDADRELALSQADAQVVELHPRAADAYAAAINNIAVALKSPEGTFDPTAIAALRRVITRITITPQQSGDALVEVEGQIEALLGIDTPLVGGAVVARGRSERIPQLLAVLRVA
jgi:hypothetical protein